MERNGWTDEACNTNPLVLGVEIFIVPKLAGLKNRTVSIASINATWPIDVQRTPEASGEERGKVLSQTEVIKGNIHASRSQVT